MSETAIRALITRWQEGVTNMYAANEEEGYASAAMLRAARAAEIERCIGELRDAMDAPHGPAEAVSPVSAATEVTGGAGEAQEAQE